MSPRFLADENVEPDLVLGLKRRVEGIDIKTVPTFAHARVVAGAIFLPIEKPPAIGPRLGYARMCP